jgi:hypothetical protein
MRRPMIDAIMDNIPFCWVNEAPDTLLYNIWLHWQVRNTH